MLFSPQIIDANLNRIAEGLRVIEEYCRFVSKNAAQTQELAQIRKQINQSETRSDELLNGRDTTKDMRSGELPSQRKSLWDLLKANFKRVEEALRVLEEYTGNALYNRLRYRMYELEKDILLTHLKPTLKPGVYLISDQVEVLEKGLKLGVSLIQLRDKTASKSEIFQKAKQLQALATPSQIPFIVNDFLDIALSINADGFHSGQDDLPIQAQRALLGPHKIIGRTTHTLQEGIEAQAQGADYVSVGPIWETPSKPGREGIGFNYLKEASKQLSIPFVAIGGINGQNIHELLPYSPPLVGLIRAIKDIPMIQKTLFVIR